MVNEPSVVELLRFDCQYTLSIGTEGQNRQRKFRSQLCVRSVSTLFPTQLAVKFVTSRVKSLDVKGFGVNTV